MAEPYYIEMPDGSFEGPFRPDLPRDVAMRQIDETIQAREAPLPARAGAAFLQGVGQTLGGLEAGTTLPRAVTAFGRGAIAGATEAPEASFLERIKSGIQRGASEAMPQLIGGPVQQLIQENAPRLIQQATGVNPERLPPEYVTAAARGAGSGVLMGPAGFGALASGMATGAAGGALGEVAARGMAGLGGGDLAQTGARLVGEVAGGVGAGAFQRGVARGFVAPLTEADITADPAKAENIRVLLSEGIPVRPSTLTGGQTRLRVEQGFGDIAGTAGREQRINESIQNAYNKAVLRRAGITDENKATDAVLLAQEEKVGRQIGDIAKRNQADFTASSSPNQPNAFSRLMDLESEYLANATPTDRDLVKSRVNQILGKMNNGIMPGQAWRELDSSIGRQIQRAESGDLKYYLGELRSIMRDALNAGIKNPDDFKSFTDARQQYANLVTIEGAMGYGPGRNLAGGNISPTALLGELRRSQGARAVATGRPDLSDLAEAGQLLNPALANSQTASRAEMMRLLQGGVAGGAMVGQGAAGAATGGATMLAAQMIPKLIQSAYYGSLRPTPNLSLAGPTASNISQGLLGTTPARGAALGAIQAQPQAEELSEEAMRSALAQNAMQRMRGLLQ